MHDIMTPPRRSSLVPAAVAFELALVGVAWGVGLIAGSPPWSSIRIDLAGAGLGVAATVPPLAAVALLLRAPWEPIRRMIREADELVRPLFADCVLTDFAAIAAAAGLGEELLFRGGVQVLLTKPLGLWGALVVSNVLFGMAHLVTRTYALIAAILGLYLGATFALTGNLLVPIVAHALYDFVALAYWLRLRRPELSE